MYISLIFFCVLNLRFIFAQSFFTYFLAQNSIFLLNLHKITKNLFYEHKHFNGCF